MECQETFQVGYTYTSLDGSQHTDYIDFFTEELANQFVQALLTHSTNLVRVVQTSEKVWRR
jgi:hypothetical protein